MALEKQISVKEITISSNGIVFYEEVTNIVEDGKVIAETSQRHSLTPGQNIDGRPEQVKAICAASWTAAVVEAFNSQA
jgi:archaellum component FlaF (FlaF/FlaG flagellin family)